MRPWPRLSVHRLRLGCAPCVRPPLPAMLPAAGRACGLALLLLAIYCRPRASSTPRLPRLPWLAPRRASAAFARAPGFVPSGARNQRPPR